MADVFISYKREDRAIAETLAHALTAMGFSVWWDFELLAGDDFRHVIAEIIDHAPACVVLWSPLSVVSRFVVDEATHADKADKLCPVFVGDCEPPLGFGGIHAENLAGWDGGFTDAGFLRLLKVLEAKTGRQARAGARAQESNAERRELAAFSAAARLGSPQAWRTFLDEHPTTQFRAFAEAHAGVDGPAAAPPPGRPAAPATEPPVRSARPVRTALLVGGAVVLAGASAAAVGMALNPERPEPRVIEEATADVAVHGEPVRKPEPVQLTLNGNTPSLAWSADSRRLAVNGAYTAYAPGENNSTLGVWVIEPSTGAVGLVAWQPAYHPVWSGDRVLFSASHHESFDQAGLFVATVRGGVRRADGGSVELFGPEGLIPHALTPGEDGTALVFHSGRMAGWYRYWPSTDRFELVELPRIPEGLRAGSAWIPAREAVTQCHQHAGEAYVVMNGDSFVVDVNGRQVSPPGDDLFEFRYSEDGEFCRAEPTLCGPVRPCLSPDGAWVAWVSRRDQPATFDVNVMWLL